MRLYGKIACMFGLDFAFDSPWFLLLLALVPVLWVLSFRSLSGLGPIRRLFALAFRTVVLVLIVLALAEIQFEQTSDKLTVIYLLDQSLSIPAAQREAMAEYAVREVAAHRNDARGDRAGVIVFGRQAAIEVPPFEDDLAIVGRLESMFDLRQDATNLAGALKLAQATFPEDSAKRVVMVTDGNENLGDAREIAAMISDRGISIYIVPITLRRRAEVAVEKVVVMSDARKGQPFDVRVVLNNLTQPSSDNSGEVSGTLILERRTGTHVDTSPPQRVVLPPGKKVFKLAQEVDQPDFYTYEARFVPDNAEDDRMVQNNQASAFTHVRGQGHILVIEDWENRGEFDFLIHRLRTKNLDVTLTGSDDLFTSLAELQNYDTVVLANVPRSSGGDADSVTAFSDAQIQMLVRNVQQMGSGLVMIGGPNSFGAGGWANTELEKAMPVDFQIRSAKVVPVGALVMTMHASEMPRGNYWQKVIGREALKALGPQDFCGIVHYGASSDEWLWGKERKHGLLKVGPNRMSMLARLDRMTPGDMPQFDPAMKLAVVGFGDVPDATVRHMIIISDGDPSPPAGSTIRALKNLNVKVTTVAVGTHGPPGSTPLQRIATQTGGKYYVVTNPKALPRIYQREARRVARPLIKEEEIQPQIVQQHEILHGINSPPPSIKGFVLTTVKQNPLVEVSMVSPKPRETQYSTLLASWTYGLGRTVAFTSDAGKRWTDRWTEWEYDNFFSQMVRWSMRPVVEEGKFTVSTDVKEGKVRVIVTALDKDDEFLNFLSISGSAVDPNMKSRDIPIQQTAPGRYVGEFDANRSGNYFLTVTVPNVSGEDPRPAIIRTGVNVPYSSEFRDRETNRNLLETLAAITPKGGQPGKLVEGTLTPEMTDNHPLLAVDTFRHDLKKAVSSLDIWHWLALVASCAFVGDVFIRRVTVHFYWVVPLIATLRDRLVGRTSEPKVDQRLERLRNRKQQIAAQIDERHAAARFKPQPDQQSNVDALTQDTESVSTPTTKQKATPQAAPTDPEEETYTERLLKAKQQVWKDRRT